MSIRSRGPATFASRIAALALCLGLWAIAPAFGQEPDGPSVAYEVVPGDLPVPGLEAMAFEDRAAIARSVALAIVPEVMRAIGLEPERTTSALEIGGWQLKVAPSIVTRLPRARADSIDRLGAALGYVLRQTAVLVFDLEASGPVAYAAIAFPGLAPEPGTALNFFLHAASIERGLAGGFTSIDGRLVFLNLRDAGGVPFSGLDDFAFAARLSEAARSFHLVPAVLDGLGKVEARLIANDWTRRERGEAYLARLDGLASDPRPALAALRARARDQVAREAEQAALRPAIEETPTEAATPAEPAAPR